jgi:DNA polymerase elongation subunit (family B)
MRQQSPQKKFVIRKDFRLIDFHIYDNKHARDRGTETSSDEEAAFALSRSKGDPATFAIQMFGVNERGETASILVEDFVPFFYVKVAAHWTQYEANALLADIKQKLPKQMMDSILDAELVDHYKLYGFAAGKKDKFVKFTFKNQAIFNKVKGFWYQYAKRPEGDNEPSERKRVNLRFQGVELELYESNIPPLLRYFHIHNISPSGWVSVQSSSRTLVLSESKTTTCKYEYRCGLAQIKPLPEKETRVPYKICSFDIEASSSHGDFPIPIKTYKRLAMNTVDVFLLQQSFLDKQKGKQLLEKILLRAFGFGACDDIDTVYPKQMPTKAQVEMMSRILINETVESVKKTNADAAKTKCLTIEAIFDEMKELAAGQREGGGEDEGEALAMGGDEPAYPTKRFAKAANKKKVEKTATILDILLSEQCDRDEKIQITNDVMTRIFPPVKGDEVTFIGSTFMNYGETQPYLNHCLVVGTCDPIEGIVVDSVEDETDLLIKWTQLIQEENPDIIIGYNIFGFDYEFMFRRAQENHCERDFLALSRHIGEVCGKVDRDGELGIENTKLVIASGEYDLRYPRITGRLQIDMYAYFRRDFNLSSYKLDDVAGQYIGDDVKKTACVTHPRHGDITELYSQNLTGLNVGDFIHIELTSFTTDYYKDGQKFRVVDIERDRTDGPTTNVILISGLHEIESGKSVRWGMAKDDVTPQDIFRLTRGSAADRAIVAKYCVQDCNLVHHLMNKIDVITGYVEMASICSVPISFLVFRGQGIKLTSYVAKKCREKDTLMPDLEKTADGGGYEGAIVLPPKCSMYMDNPVACVDYASLYPSSMISQNFSHDSKVWTREYDLDGNLIKVTGERDKTGRFIYDELPGEEYINIEFDTYRYIRKTPTSRAEKTKSGKMVCRWAQNKKGIMPAILEELLKARSDTRKKIKTEKDPFMQNILDKRQLGYKVTANSLYGQCGSRTSTFYERDVAASTTATGRMMITYAKRIIEEVYGDMVYETAIHGPVRTKAEYVYGDSAANYTPVYIRINRGVMGICTIEALAEKYGGNQWITCREQGKQEKEYCELSTSMVETWTEKGWTRLYRIIRHTLASNKKMIRVVTHTGLVDVTDDHSLLKPSGEEVSPKEVSVGSELLHHPLPKEFGYHLFPGSVSFECEITTNEKHVEYARYCAYAQARGLSIHFSSSSRCSFLYKSDKLCDTRNPNEIIAMHEIPYEGYVYDLTTENHHFAAGIGNMIVHNTDSVFFTFNLENPETGEKIRGKPALEMTIEIAQDAAQLCTQWLKSPMELSYEKTLMPFVLLSKKRYVGMLYETDPKKGKLKYMGLSLKRRDSCDYLKDVYGEILNILMKKNDVMASIQFLDKSLNDLIAGKVPMDKLAITKALRSDYKNPQQIGHKVLADRMGKRDPGNKPKPGDRIKFVFVVNPDPKALMGDKIETPEYIIENKLQIDYAHYITNQLMKPLQQLFGLALEAIWEHRKKKSAIRAHQEEIRKLEREFPDVEVFMKKREKCCSAKVKTLLFDDVLTKIANKKNHVQPISAFFQKK